MNTDQPEQNEPQLRPDLQKIADLWEENKKMGLFLNSVKIKPAGVAGLGVFANKKFKKDEIVEFCHSIELGWRRRYIADPSIIQYAYWDSCPCRDCKVHGARGFLPLGYGAIYNSAENELSANVRHIVLSSHRLIVFVAAKNIHPGEELVTWWGQKYYDSWCAPRHKKEQENE